MDIVLASDDNYSPHLATLIYSIFENNENEFIKIHILDNNITKENKDKIAWTTTAFENKLIEFYPFTSKDIEKRIGIDVKHDRSLSSYARLFIPEILSDDIKVALYLDSDGLVKGSLIQLFNLDFNNNYIAGVKDIVSKDTKKAVGLNDEDDYINAGFIVWNLEKCREDNIIDKFVKFIVQRDGDVLAMDQGTINGCLKSNILILNPENNVLTPFFQFSYEELVDFYNLNKYYSKELINKSISEPIFIHFVPNLTNRPWGKNCSHPFTSDYWEVRNKTPFNRSVFEKDSRPLKIRILSALFNVLSYKKFKFILKLYSKIQKRRLI